MYLTPRRILLAGATGLTGEQFACELILQLLLDHPLERPGAIDRVVALLREPGAGFFVQIERDVAVGEALGQARDLDVDDSRHLRLEQAVEQQDFVQAV